MVREVVHGLPYGICGALEPLVAFRGLLGGEDIYEAMAEHIEVVGIFDMLVERRRVVLGDHEHAFQAGVEAVGDRDIYQAIFSGDRDGGFGALAGQRGEAASGPTAQDKGNHFDHSVRIRSVHDRVAYS